MSATDIKDQAEDKDKDSKGETKDLRTSFNQMGGFASPDVAADRHVLAGYPLNQFSKTGVLQHNDATQSFLSDWAKRTGKAMPLSDDGQVAAILEQMEHDDPAHDPLTYVTRREKAQLQTDLFRAQIGPEALGGRIAPNNAAAIMGQDKKAEEKRKKAAQLQWETHQRYMSLMQMEQQRAWHEMIDKMVKDCLIHTQEQIDEIDRYLTKFAETRDYIAEMAGEHLCRDADGYIDDTVVAEVLAEALNRTGQQLSAQVRMDDADIMTAVVGQLDYEQTTIIPEKVKERGNLTDDYKAYQTIQQQNERSRALVTAMLSDTITVSADDDPDAEVFLMPEVEELNTQQLLMLINHAPNLTDEERSLVEDRIGEQQTEAEAAVSVYTAPSTDLSF